MKYKCTICNEIFEGETCPKVCPVCSASEDKFIQINEAESKFEKNTDEYFLIIGNGAAGYYAAETIRKINKTCKITIVSNESELSYYRPALSDLINSNDTSKFYIVDESWYKENDIYVLLNTNVEKINEESQTVTLDTGFDLRYDKLILANGSRNFIPPVKGHDLENVFSLRDFKDLNDIKNAMNNSSKVVVIGGGLLGLEAAWEFRKNGLEVVIVDIAENILPRQLNKEASLILEKYIKDTDTQVLLNTFLDYVDGDKKVESVVFKDGSSIKCDMVVFSTGVRANTQITKDTLINVDRGIVVNKYMETSSKNIYACGDIAQLDNMNLAIWPVATQMGKIAGKNACGDYTTFVPEVYPINLEAFNTSILSVGNIGDFDKELVEENTEDVYKKLFFKEGILVGAILVNDLSETANIITNIGKELAL